MQHDIQFFLIILAALLGIRLFFIFFKSRRHARGGGGTPQQNPYDGLKRLAYATTYGELHLPDPAGAEILYGALTDWDYEGKAIITLVSFLTGDASLYISTGAVILGGGQHAAIAQASKAFLHEAETLLPEGSSADTELRPEPGMFKVYLLTTRGRYTVSDKVGNVYHGASRLGGLFAKANELISAIRAVTRE